MIRAVVREETATYPSTDVMQQMFTQKIAQKAIKVWLRKNATMRLILVKNSGDLAINLSPIAM